jgi:hypothetical protein
MSRNPHDPTAVLRAKVRSLSAVGLPQDDIAQIIGCAPKTLRLHYRHELDEGAADANAVVVEALLTQINRGNVSAMIFFEKCRGGKREKIKEEITRRPPSLIITPHCDRATCERVKEHYFKFNFKLHYPDNEEQRQRNIQKIRQLIEEKKANARK